MFNQIVEKSKVDIRSLLSERTRTSAVIYSNRGDSINSAVELYPKVMKISEEDAQLVQVSLIDNNITLKSSIKFFIKPHPNLIRYSFQNLPKIFLSFLLESGFEEKYFPLLNQIYCRICYLFSRDTFSNRLREIEYFEIKIEKVEQGEDLALLYTIQIDFIDDSRRDDVEIKTLAGVAASLKNDDEIIIHHLALIVMDKQLIDESSQIIAKNIEEENLRNAYSGGLPGQES